MARRRKLSGGGMKLAVLMALLHLCLFLDQAAAGYFVREQNVLNSEEMPWLESGASLREGLYRLQMREDCELVLWKRFREFGLEGKAWSSGTAGAGTGCFLVMQKDGNLVIYSQEDVPVWSCCPRPLRARNRDSFSAVLQKDGGFVVRTSSGLPIWSTADARN